MTLAEEYKRQFAWRDWETILAALPPLHGQTVLDLGCGVGDVAAALAARSARIIGVDMNEELLQAARSKNIANAEFRCADVRNLADLGVTADGVWSSFSSAYFTDLTPVLTAWKNVLKSGGWIALTEIDDLFGHEPVSARTRTLLDAYMRDGLQAGRYDFYMGRKLQGYLERAGFSVSKVLTVVDQELSFSGAAQPEVIVAWRTRFERMKLLHSFCGAEYETVRDDFLNALVNPEHRSNAKVYCCIAHK